MHSQAQSLNEVVTTLLSQKLFDVHCCVWSLNNIWNIVYWGFRQFSLFYLSCVYMAPHAYDKQIFWCHHVILCADILNGDLYCLRLKPLLFLSCTRWNLFFCFRFSRKLQVIGKDMTVFLLLFAGTVMTPNYINSNSLSVAPWCNCNNSGNDLEECMKFLNFFQDNACLSEYNMTLCDVS